MGNMNNYPWDKMTGLGWCDLLRTRPHYAEYCDWDKLSGGVWAWLLGDQPQLAGHCQWEKLEKHDWEFLLCRRFATFRNLCNTEEIQLLAVEKSDKILKNIDYTSDRVKRLHEIKWVL